MGEGRLLMLDLYAGRGGSSVAMVERGWEVHRVEREPGLLQPPLGAKVADYTADVLTWRWPLPGRAPDLLWASPPCTEFTRTALPWIKDAAAPDMRFMFAALAHVATLRPRWWAIENVKGAIPWFMPWLGPPCVSASPVFLWGRLPPVVLPGRARKEAITGRRPDLRSFIPYEVSAAMAAAIERAEGRAA